MRQYTDDLFLTRYTTDFSLDDSFGANSEVHLPSDSYFLSVQLDGKILDAIRNGYLFRLNPDGSPDSGFPQNIGPFAELSALVTDGEGNILVADVDYVPDRCSARVYAPDGALLGKVYDTVSWQPDNFCFPGVFLPYPQGGFVWSWLGKRIYKVNLDGSPDLSFGDQGRVELEPLLGEVFPSFLYLATGSVGQVYFTGSLYIDGAGHPLVGGLDQFGQSGSGFGSLGYVHLNLPIDEMEAIYTLPDGKLLLAVVDDPNYLLMRLMEYPLSARMYLPWVNR